MSRLIFSKNKEFHLKQILLGALRVNTQEDHKGKLKNNKSYRILNLLKTQMKATFKFCSLINVTIKKKNLQKVFSQMLFFFFF